MVGLLFITVYPYLRRYIYIVWPVGLYARFVPAFSKRVLALARGSSSLRPDKNPGEKERREELFSKFKESTLKSFCSCWPRRVCACKGRGGERGGFEKWIRI